MSVPAWVQDSIFYQIFPDRFASGRTDNNPKSVLAWKRQTDTLWISRGRFERHHRPHVLPA